MTKWTKQHDLEFRRQMEKTAKADYEAKHKELCRRIALLMTAADKHQKKAQADEKNWGYAGDLGHVNELLAQTLHTLGVEEFVER